MMPPDRTTILVIDDEDAVRQSIADFLEDMDYRVLTAENGRIGIELFEQQNADLVLVDLRMPEMDGLEVLTHITGVSPDTPMIVVSGTGVISDAVEALHQGAWDYLLKPINDFSVLVHAIDNALEKARLKRENLQYQQRLEQMVADRTKELEQANEHLTLLNERLERIVDTTRTLSFCDEVQKFGSMLLDEFGRHMQSTGGSLYFKEKDGLHLVHTLDPGHAPAFIPFPISENSVFQRVMSQNKPTLIPDITSMADLTTSGWEHYEDGSALVFPLPDESGEITAILTLHGKKPPPFVEQDRELGAILASYSSEALRAVRATETLRENEQQFRSILDNIQAGIVIVDKESRRVVYVNPVAAELAGASPEEILGGRCTHFLCPAKDDKCPILDLGNQDKSAEKIVTTCDGREIPILKTVSRTIYQGKECLLESYFDLTAQKRMEKEKAALETQLRQAQKLEALGTLAGGIAHDFNNILSAIIGNAELSFLKLDDPTHPLHPKLKSILNAGNRAKELVSQILTFSRMQDHIFTPISIAPIVKETLKLLEASLPANIELKMDIASQQQVMADPTQIHQVIMNLCTNAYHAMEENGGNLTVSLASVSGDGKPSILPPDLPPGNYLELTVEDTGSGISPSVMDSIFDPYFTTKDKNKGTGLGLSVVHGIVKTHGGAITVKSKIGQGTVFQVYFPVTDNDAETMDGRQTIPPHGNERVLLVDDEAVLVDIGSQILDNLGYDVTGVVGSGEALNIFRLSPYEFDLVITDLNMPFMAGDQLARELIRIRPDIPIILCTGFSDRFDEKQAHIFGIRKIMRKPAGMKIVAETVREVLDDL